MNKNFKNNMKFNDEINLQEFLKILIKGKWLILSVTAIFSIMGVIYSLQLPNIYQSKAILVPVDSSDRISGTLQKYGGIAGLNLPSSVSESNSVKAINKISSLSFFKNNIMPKIFLPNLMALKSWDSGLNKLIYDEKVFILNSGTWTEGNLYPNKRSPSAQQSYLVFLNKHLNINEDAKTGFITITIKHQSPYIAKYWAELVIEEVNHFYREKDKLESQKAVSYLNKQIAITGFSEIKQAIAQLLQQETQKLTLIEANESYVFDYIDPPAVMEQKSEPRRSLICALSALIGVILSFFMLIIQDYFVKKRVLNEQN